jgi:VWFA-related protein
MQCRSRRIVLWFLGIAGFCVAGIGEEPAHQVTPDPQRIRVESALVTVPVIASDSQGRFLSGLPAGSFKLFEDGFHVPISLFLTSEDPIKIALLIDTSRSAATVLRRIKKAAQQFLLQMRDQDVAMVAGFDSDMHVLCPFSSDQRELKDSIQRARSGGSSTKMRDAIHEVALQRFRAVTGRKAIILLTDGQDQGSQISAKALLTAIAASNTLIYSISYSVNPRELAKELFGVELRGNASTASWDARQKEASQFLEKISDLSAGRHYASSIKDLDRVFQQITGELRNQYLLGFYPEESKLDGTAHTLVVSVSVPDAVVRSRRSYRAAP